MAKFRDSNDTHLTLSLPLLSYLALLLDSLLVLVIASRILWDAEEESPVFRGRAGVGSLSLSLGLYLEDLVLSGLASGDRCCKKFSPSVITLYIIRQPKKTRRESNAYIEIFVS